VNESILILTLSLATILPFEDAMHAKQACISGHGCVGLNHPAILHAYDPGLGGINCDDDCTTVATGQLLDSMYKTSGACPVELLGATVTFHDIGVEMKCVDTGGDIKPAWSERDEQCVVYFDMLWPLEVQDDIIIGGPYWNHWFLPNWSVSW
jgi:hypothetical protein